MVLSDCRILKIPKTKTIYRLMDASNACNMVMVDGGGGANGSGVVDVMVAWWM